MKISIIIFFYILTSTLFSQKEYFNWYFGNKAGVTFNSPDGHPLVLHNSRIAALEGCASISNQRGELLFYTNGVDVWNRKHLIMKNGNGIAGNRTSTQTALILPVQIDTNKYLIFTVDYTFVKPYSKDTILNNGLRYTVIDMKQDSGFGDVTEKNVLLLDSTTEKLTAVKHSNNRDYWIITHQWASDRFVLIKMDENGNLSEPMFQNIGSKHIFEKGTTHYYDETVIGYMKVSPNRKKLALAIFGLNAVELFDFDNSTGTISNCISIRDSINQFMPYGLEFSPDGNLLYVSAFLGEFTNSNQVQIIYQLDLKNTNPDSMYLNKFTVWSETGSNYYVGALQQGPDDRIYFSLYPYRYLSSIDEPNKSGPDCKFILNSLKLSTITNAQCTYGLPNFTNVPFVNSVKIEAGDVCGGDSIVLISKVISRAFIEKYSWTGPNNFSSNLKNPIIRNSDVTMSGLYRLTIRTDFKEYSDSIFITVKPTPYSEINGADSCYENSIYNYSTEQISGYEYKWTISGGNIIGSDTESVVKVKWDNIGAGIVELDVISLANECSSKNLFQVEIIRYPNLYIQGNDAVCENDTLRYTMNSDSGFISKWTVENGRIIFEDADEIHVKWESAGQGQVKAERINKLTQLIDSATLTITIFNRPAKTNIIETDNNSLMASGGIHFEWYCNGELINGENSSELKPKKNGIYQVICIDSNGCRSDMSEPYDFILNVESILKYEHISPNPASDYIDISYPPSEKRGLGGVSFVVYDILGMKITTPSLHATPPYQGGEIVRFDVSGLLPGVYFIRIGDIVQKFVKM